MAIADNDEREQHYDSGRATDEVKVAPGFAEVLVSITWFGIDIAFRLAALCACLTCSVICLVLSSGVDN